MERERERMSGRYGIRQTDDEIVFSKIGFRK